MPMDEFEPELRRMSDEEDARSRRITAETAPAVPGCTVVVRMLRVVIMSRIHVITLPVPLTSRLVR